MSFTAAATTELTKRHKQVRWRLQLKTNFAASNTWQDYDLPDNWDCSWTPGEPWKLTAELANEIGVYSNETDQSNRLTLGAKVRLIAYVGAEWEVKFEGEIVGVSPTDWSFGFLAADPSFAITTAECEVTITPSEVVVTDDNTPRQLYLCDGTATGSLLGKAFGFQPDLSGTDPAFDEATQLLRRSWVPGNTRIWRDAAMAPPSGTDPGDEVPSKHWQIDYVSGAISILELVSYNITAVNQGSKTFTISGTHSYEFKAGRTFTIIGSTGNNGTYTVDTSSVGAGNTVITVLEAIPDASADGSIQKTYYATDVRAYLESAATGATNVDLARAFEQALQTAKTEDGGGLGLSAGDLDITDTLIDFGKAISFRGKVSDFFAQIQKDFQANIQYHYDATQADIVGDTPGKHVVRLVTQKAPASVDHTLLHEQSISQPREVRDLYTRVVITGKAEMPLNQLTRGTITDLRAAGEWFKHTQPNGGPNGGGADHGFAVASPLLYDGDTSYGAGIHNIPSADYSTYYELIKIELLDDEGTPAVVNIDRFRATMAPSANPNQGMMSGVSGGTTIYFWPGIKVEVSENDADYFPLSAAVNEVRYKPGSEVDISDSQITRPRARYVKLSGAPYKQGISNQADPAVSFGEIEIYTNSRYRIVKCIYPTAHAITALDQGTPSFTIAGDHTAVFTSGIPLTVVDSTGNDGTYTCDGDSVLSGTDTVITVVEAIPDATADGTLGPCYRYTNGTTWPREYADLYTRFAGWRSYFEDVDNRFNEFLAHDYALMLLTEKLRIFQVVTHHSVCDPRIKPWQTVLIPDRLNNATFDIVAATSATPSFTLAGDLVAAFPSGVTLDVIGSSDNDGTYTVDGTPVYSGGNTVITVSEPIASDTADGDISQRSGILVDKGIAFGQKGTTVEGTNYLAPVLGETA